MANRDEFSEKTKLQIAKRAGWLCSFPACRTPTVGATSDGEGEINIGTAAHICAAAPGGPRYDAAMSPQQRSSASNGIWMCRDHGKAIDSVDPEFTVKRLREWKQQAERESWQRVLRKDAADNAPAAKEGPSAARLVDAARADIEVFRRTSKWPSTSVALALEVSGLEAPVTTDMLAVAAVKLDDIILVAPPGMGKTTTIFQIAEAVLANSKGAPIIVLLSDWATEGATLLSSVLSRPAFKGISESDFREAAAQPGVVLLLDGWNELDALARARARVQISALKAELPELGLVVSTRKQVLDVPFSGARVELLALSEGQQLEIAVAMRGEGGARLLDEAWRTPGVRELVTIPLYLTALLSLPDGAPFPATKEAVLRHFVAAHETEARRAEALKAVTQGLQQHYLDALAVFATQAANTAISDNSARRSISETEALLVKDGQIAVRPEPDAVLEVLVSDHVLMRAGETPGVAFQHQQFQEWYASHTVERRIIAEVDDPSLRKALKAEIFDLPIWEEAILFAVERMARADGQQQAACGKAIVAAFAVDPMLAAEMIFRASEGVWSPISATILELIAQWHAVGKVDRAVRFMLTSGRPEFLDVIWPLISDENEQISLKALRNCRRFRPSVLGADAENKIKALPAKPRLVLLHEVASHSGVDGLDLAVAIAKTDPDPDVQASVIEALAFRRADRHVAAILKQAGDQTYDLVAGRDLIDEVEDEDVRKGIAAARARQAADKTSAYERLRAIAYAHGGDDRSADLTEIVSTMEIEKRQDAEVNLVYEARGRYPRAVADALLIRVREGRALFYGADDILASAGFQFEDDALAEIALSDPAAHDDRAEAAASVLGPNAVGRMVDALLELAPRIRTDRAAGEAFSGIQRRLAHVPGASLAAAVQARSNKLDDEQMARVAALFWRRPGEEDERARPFDAGSLAIVQGFVEDWGARMLASDKAERWHKAEIATLASYAPSAAQLNILKRLHDDNLQRYRGFREEVETKRLRQGPAMSEARQPHTGEYQRAFMAIKTPETAALMRDYLEDEHFGALAAQVLADQWRAANEPPPGKRVMGGIDFSRVQDKRQARAAHPETTCDEAEAVFAAIDRLIGDGTTEKQHKLAVALSIVALRLPHGERGATIRKLIGFAPREAYGCARSDLLLSLVLSGEDVDIDDVAGGIAETLEAAKKDAWILTQSDGWYVKAWLRLLPFTNSPARALAVIQDLVPQLREPRFLEETVGASRYAAPAAAEAFLFGIAEQDPRFYMDYAWRAAVIGLGTHRASRRFIDLVANDAFSGKSSSDRSHLVRQLAALIAGDAALRAHVYTLLKEGSVPRGRTLLADAVAESPDVEGVLLLLELEPLRPRISWRTIEHVVTEHIPVENWNGAYNVAPVAAAELRRKLLALTKDGGAADIAARHLTYIDHLRDEHGRPDIEPRHPDLASGKAWPIMAPDPNATSD